MFKYDVPPFVRSRASLQVEAFLELSQEQRETFMVLLPEWVGTVEDLIQAVKFLT